MKNGNKYLYHKCRRRGCQNMIERPNSKYCGSECKAKVDNKKAAKKFKGKRWAGMKVLRLTG